MKTFVLGCFAGAALMAATAAHAQNPVPAPTLDTRNAETELRLMEMENQLRRVTGQYEEAMYRLTQVNRRLERALEDMEYRVQTLEQRASSLAPADDAALAEAGSGDPAVPQDVAAVRPDLPPDVLTIPDPNAPPPADVPDATPETAPDQFLEGVTPEQHFAGAFTLLRRDELEGAENAFRAFLTLHPNHALSANAKYWLGKTYFARGDFDAAARTMLEGFQAHADSDKGPDILLHLGLSLSQIGQQQDACAAFDELAARYPNADVAVTQRAVSGRRVAGCG